MNGTNRDLGRVVIKSGRFRTKTQRRTKAAAASQAATSRPKPKLTFLPVVVPPDVTEMNVKLSFKRNTDNRQPVKVVTLSPKNASPPSPPQIQTLQKHGAPSSGGHMAASATRLDTITDAPRMRRLSNPRIAEPPLPEFTPEEEEMEVDNMILQSALYPDRNRHLSLSMPLPIYSTILAPKKKHQQPTGLVLGLPRRAVTTATTTSSPVASDTEEVERNSVENAIPNIEKPTSSRQVVVDLTSDDGNDEERAQPAIPLLHAARTHPVQSKRVDAYITGNYYGVTDAEHRKRITKEDGWADDELVNFGFLYAHNSRF